MEGLLTLEHARVPEATRRLDQTAANRHETYSRSNRI